MAEEPNHHCDIAANFAFAFRNWRLKHKIPLKRIAMDLHVTIATISLWESGKRFPTARHFEKLTRYTGMRPCRLFCVMAAQCRPVDCLLANPQKKR
jgi:transcriptional regulator with XRE-family HTH domain